MLRNSFASSISFPYLFPCLARCLLLPFSIPGDEKVNCPTLPNF